MYGDGKMLPPPFRALIALGERRLRCCACRKRVTGGVKANFRYARP